MAEKQSLLNISVVIPVYNEAQGIGTLFSLLKGELEKLPDCKFEVMLVNDGSTDDTQAKLKEISSKHPEIVRVINLTRNFGKEAALSAGLHNISGDCAITMDADGQHPPSKIGEFIAVYKQGYDMVVGVRTQNFDEKNLKKLGNRFYYWLLRLSGIAHLQPRITDFRVINRAVVDRFSELSERRRITRGLLDWMGFKTAYVEFEAPVRLAGNATYSMRKLVYLAVDSILSNSRKPLAISIVLGGLITTLGLMGSIFVTVEKYMLGDPLSLNFSGVTLLILVALFMIGLTFISQGIASLYLARIYEEVQQRPLYIIDYANSSPHLANKQF